MLEHFNILLADLSPIERWRGRNWPTHTVSFSWVQYVLVAVGLVLLVSLAILIRRRLQSQSLKGRFSQQATQHGLSAAESKILATLAALAGLRHPYTIFTTEEAFEAGVSALLTSQRTRELSPQARGCLSDTLVSLRQKLGFGAGELESEGLRNTRQVAEGSTITILAGPAPVTANVAETNMLDMVVQTPAPLGVKPEQKLPLRYCDGRSIWEFDMPVLRVQGERITLAHVEQVRFVNRRRFPRIAVSKPSLAALFPFIKPLGASELPQFEKGKLVEIAGPSIKLQTPLHLEKGNTVLAILELNQDKTVQAMGRVIRAHADGETCEAVVALMATDAAGIDEMVHQTSLAEKQSTPADGEQAEMAMAGA